MAKVYTEMTNRGKIEQVVKKETEKPAVKEERMGAVTKAINERKQPQVRLIRKWPGHAMRVDTQSVHLSPERQKDQGNPPLTLLESSLSAQGSASVSIHNNQSYIKNTNQSNQKLTDPSLPRRKTFATNPTGSDQCRMM